MHPAVTRAPLRPLRRVVSATVTFGLALGVGAALSAAPAAAATADTTHDPVGSVWSVAAVTGGLQMKGWGLDPDDPSANATVSALVDGRTTVASTTTRLASASVTAKYRTSKTPVFVLTVPVPAGRHTVCTVIKNVRAGLDTVRRCVATPLGATLTSSQVAARSPRGAVTSSWANAGSVHVRGWATDPDHIARRSLVVLYVDGSAVSTVASRYIGWPRPAGAGALSKFDILVPTSVGTHIVCVWVVNVGLGRNTHLGCKALDNRNPMNRRMAASPAPALNAKVLALATKQIGKPYVWGAVGPKAFDCSGLVMWTYAKYGVTTPRVSQDQRKATRLIPASRARPGDLVFHHDSVGDVYHVGIYQKPGVAVAAIEPGRGVDYQQLWDPTVTYGSFTHT